MPLSSNITKSFFDRPHVKQIVDREMRTALVGMGALTRTIARGSMRRRPGASPPGTPPHAHAGGMKLIFFAYEQASSSVVVGPIRFGKGNGRSTVPETLEFGGFARVRDRRSVGGKKRVVRVRVAARPYMLPALKNAAPKFPGLIKDKVLE